MFRFHASQPWRARIRFQHCLGKKGKKGKKGVRWSLELAGVRAARRRQQPTSALAALDCFPTRQAQHRNWLPDCTEHLLHSNQQAPAQEGGDTGLAAQAILILCCPVYYFTILLFYYLTSNDQGTWGTRDDHDVQLCAQESIIPRSHKYHSSPAFTSKRTHTLSAIRLRLFGHLAFAFLHHRSFSFDFTPLQRAI